MRLSDSLLDVHGMLTEPGETSTIFTLFSSIATGHPFTWRIMQVRFARVLLVSPQFCILSFDRSSFLPLVCEHFMSVGVQVCTLTTHILLRGSLRVAKVWRKAFGFFRQHSVVSRLSPNDYSCNQTRLVKTCLVVNVSDSSFVAHGLLRNSEHHHITF